jgi:flagellar hook protein FlgE
MLQALLAGVASVKAQQTRMNVIGNNLANVNTTAYKSARVTFQDMIAQTIQGATLPTSSKGGTNPKQYGLGVLVGATDVNNEQGSLGATNRPSDMAIQGSGYFMVPSGDGVAYTRDGAFDLDANGDLVQTSTGSRLLGWKADSLGKVDTTAPVSKTSALNIPIGRLNAVQATTYTAMKGNLNASAAPAETYTTQVRVYDALGGAHDISVVYSNHSTNMAADPLAPATARSSWDWAAYEGDAATGLPIGNSSTTGNEKLYFDDQGAGVSSLAAGIYNQMTVPAGSSSSPVAINIDFSAIGQLENASQIASTSQDGFPPGSLEGYNIGTDGVITGLFTNGLTRPLGQIALSNFPNPNGLSRVGNNTWRATDNSGTAVVGTAQSGGRGAINSGYLEQSNVDISTEFSDLIITQRGFQANTKIITTVDEMLQDLINMKR